MGLSLSSDAKVLSGAWLLPVNYTADKKKFVITQGLCCLSPHVRLSYLASWITLLTLVIGA
jgi:hypothetical protein